MPVDAATLSTTIHALPGQCKGPGGAVAVVKDGKVVARQAWGYANIATRARMTSQTIMPICSITKQFTCAVLLDVGGDPVRLNPALAAYLPLLEGARPDVAQLCHNQSGLRDYPALTILCGADPEGPFSPTDARRLLSRMRTTQFRPGSQYSYANSNFHILSDLVEAHTGRPLGNLFAEQVFAPAGMRTARFEPDSSRYDLDCTGYEGTADSGYVPAVNRSHWTGDAGISASLDDMVAWETFVDATRDDPGSLYRRIAREQTFANGRPASYGFGLAHVTMAGVAVTGHGGGMRGWRLWRGYAASERLSVVVMFNHEADAHGAADTLMSAALGRGRPVENRPAGKSWLTGHFIDDTSGLSLSLADAGSNRPSARFLGSPEVLEETGDGAARSPAMVLSLGDARLRLERSADNLSLLMRPLLRKGTADIEGRFHCKELAADFVCDSAGGAMYGAFEGSLGRSDAYLLESIGDDVWLLPSRRAIDVAPGDWTLMFKRDRQGAVTGVIIGCWLARSLVYEKT